MENKLRSFERTVSDVHGIAVPPAQAIPSYSSTLDSCRWVSWRLCIWNFDAFCQAIPVIECTALLQQLFWDLFSALAAIENIEMTECVKVEAVAWTFLWTAQNRLENSAPRPSWSWGWPTAGALRSSDLQFWLLCASLWRSPNLYSHSTTFWI